MIHLQRRQRVGNVHRHDAHHPGDSRSRGGDHPGNDRPDGGTTPHDHYGDGPTAFACLLSSSVGTPTMLPTRSTNALEANAAGRRALGISLIGLGVTAVLQAFVVALSGSVALFGDTLHNVADALTAVPLLVAFRLARRPANKRYTYGYWRAEDLGGLFVIAMIALSSVLAAYEAIHSLLHPQQVNHLWAVAGAAVIGFLGNEMVARYRIRVGRQISSAALIADGLHARTDGFTSLAVLLGAGGVALGLPWADPVVGLLITVAILGALRSAVKQVGTRLMDAVDPTIVDQATTAITSIEGVRQIRELRIRWIGHTLRAEVDITADPDSQHHPSPRPRASRRSAPAHRCASPHRRHSSHQPRWRPPPLVN